MLACGSHIAPRSRILGEEVVNVGVAELFISPPCRTTHRQATILSMPFEEHNSSSGIELASHGSFSATNLTVALTKSVETVGN